jgi:hypothetical protein
MLAEMFMIWLEEMQRQPTATAPRGSGFVPFNPANFGLFKDSRRRRLAGPRRACKLY